MDGDRRALCDAVGRAVVARDYAAVHGLFAPWLQAEVDPAEIERRLDAAQDGLAHPPASWRCDEGLAGFEDLQTPDEFGPPTRQLSDRITAATFRGWFSIQFAPAEDVHEEQNVCYDVWLLAVEHDGALRIGYFEPWEAS